MPVKVKGMSFQPVKLPELRDSVFFGQTKVFDDVQRAGSPSLKSAIAAGLLAVLEETPLAIPMATQAAKTVLVQKPVVTTPVAAPATVDMDAVTAKMVEAVTANVVAAMAAAAQPAAQPVQDNTTAQAISDLSKKIDGLRVSGTGVAQQTTLPSAEYTAADEIFIPTINVDDMHNNVRLETRNLGQGGQVNSALAALRNLKNKQS